jgi:hypothetical protein
VRNATENYTLLSGLPFHSPNFFRENFAKFGGEKRRSGRCVLPRQDWFSSDSQANTLIGLPVAVGLEVARAAYKKLTSFKQAQRSGYTPKRFQHSILGVKNENVKI